MKQTKCSILYLTGKQLNNLVYIFYGKAFSALLVVWCPPYFRYLLYVAAYISFFG